MFSGFLEINVSKLHNAHHKTSPFFVDEKEPVHFSFILVKYMKYSPHFRFLIQTVLEIIGQIIFRTVYRLYFLN